MSCRACGGLTDVVFEMDPMPLAGAFAATESEARAAVKYPLAWCRCRDCGLVNVEPDIPDDLIYSTYSYAASTVPALVRHHRDFAAELASRYPSDLRLLEVGCNDGVLLNQLPSSWVTIGVDPSDVALEATLRSSAAPPYHLYNVPFNMQVARWVGQVDVVTSSNSFAHFTAIGEALDAVAKVLRLGGDFWLEVHDLEATLESGQWDTVYTEHKAEWSLGSLRRAVEPRGFELAELWRLPLHGGLLRARFRRGRPWLEARYTTPNFEPLRRAYRERRAPELPDGAWAYGAAARATVYLNQVPVNVAAIVDGSPLRQGKFVPGTGTPIVSPEEFDRVNPPACLITAWNHAGDIKTRHPQYAAWGATW